jgi:hypothetical protein
MKKMISFCGLLCSECGAFIATQNNDDKKRAEVAQLWSKQYGVNLKAEDINCDGCISDSDRLVGHTRVCEIENAANKSQSQTVRIAANTHANDWKISLRLFRIIVSG